MVETVYTFCQETEVKSLMKKQQEGGGGGVGVDALFLEGHLVCCTETVNAQNYVTPEGEERLGGHSLRNGEIKVAFAGVTARQKSDRSNSLSNQIQK